MLRNILSKLPVLNNLADVPTQPCNVRMLRSLSPTAHECRRDTKARRQSSKPFQKRSYSFPFARQKVPQANGGLQQYKNGHKNNSQDPNSNVLTNRRDPHQKVNAPITFPESAADVKKFYDNYEVAEQYELEASKPRRSQSELDFNVFKHMEELESKYDPIDHLQPNNLKPFGSMDNVYNPIMIKTKGSNVLQLPKSNAEREPELSSSVKRNRTKDNLQHREYSTNTRSFRGTPQGPVELIDSLPLFDESGRYKTKKPKPNQSTRKAIPVRHFLSKPKPNEGVEEALGVAKECRKKLIESKYACEEDFSRVPWCSTQIAISLPDTLTDSGQTPETLLEHTTSKKPATKLATPWLSYSDTLKKPAMEYVENSHTSKPELDDEEIASPSEKAEYNNVGLHKRAPQPPEIKSKNSHENIFQRQNTASAFQRRMLATEPKLKKNVAQTVKSNLHVSVVSKLLPIKKSLPSEKTYIKANSYAKTTRSLEPKSYEKPPEKKKCFLPSKVRLKPPICTPKPPPCPVPEPCVRSDDCLEVKPKKLPVLKASDCPCVEDVGPEINPKMKRLCFEFSDPPRVCPEVPPCAPRADDNFVAKPKKLASLKPNDCVCVEPPPMTDVKLKRLQKICVPEEKCYPKPECPQPPPCVRADDNQRVCEKPLPQLKASYCPCVEPERPKNNPKMKRLKFCFRDPPKPKICEPIDPCAPRADARFPEKPKKLPKFEPSNCECIESPPMIDVPLKRLQKICVPEEKCYPKKECPVPEPCIRADDCWKPKIKPLPIIKDGPCICIEPYVPDKIPKLKRLDVECEDQPRSLICQPVNPCPPRADESLKPKIKKLPHIEMGNCRCIDAPPMIDVPLKRLQKVCEPEEKCYPKKICPQPEPCLRADDTLCIQPKMLPPLEAKPCPCVETPPLKQAPALRRLELKVCEPPKKCPKPKICEEVPRADDLRQEKTRKLPKLRAGDCPCVDQPMVEAPRLERLVCKDEPEECLEVDPCLDTPRADMGCWEYHNPVEPKCESKKVTKKGVSYNSKRRYNTDSRMSLFKEIKNSVGNNKSSSAESSRLNEASGRAVVRKVCMLSSRSSPTLDLLKELGDLEKKTPSRIAFDVTLEKKLDVRKMSRKSSDQQDTKMKRGQDMKMHGGKKKPVCHKVGSPCSLTKLPCTSTKCKPSCDKERIPVCCDKKPSPYPAFSELAEEEVEPFSDNKQFTCGRKEYGFQPRYKRPHGPVFRDKYDKKYSTLVSKEETRDIEYCSGKDHSRVYLSAGGTRLDNKGNPDLARGLPGTNIAYLPLESKFSQLLKQRANYGVIGIDTSFPKISSGETSPAFSWLRTTPSLSRNISVHSKNSYSIIRSKSSSSKKHKKCKPKKKKCPKFKMENCPEPAIRPNCQKKRPIYVCVKEKSKAPYPAFTDCLDEELAENLGECPIEREKIRDMQPSFMHPLEKPKVTKPVEPVLGKIDPLKEHECVKAKLAIENKGLSQSCHDFGKSQKVMRAKHYLKDVNRDCIEIERLRKLGKWPPKNSRGLCHVSNNSFCMQRRGMCKTAKNPKACEIEKAIEKHELHKDHSSKLNTCPNSIYIRKYHVLCTKPEKKLTDDFDIRPNEVSQHQLTEDDSCKFMKLRNVQWRINNFRKWHRLQKMSSSPDFSKKLCSGTRKFACLGQSQKTFSTSATKLVSIPEPLEAFVQRGISTTYILAEASAKKRGIFSMKGNRSKSCPKFSLPRKKRDACEWKYPDRSGKKLPSPYPAFSECKQQKMCECPKRKEQLQPQYPILPEISSGSLPERSPQLKLDLSIDEEYARQKFGVKKEGLTLDCNTFGVRRKPMSSKVAKEKYEMMSTLEGGKEFTNCSSFPEWCRTDKIHDSPTRRTLAKDCDKPKSENCNKEASECDHKENAIVPTEETARPEEENPCLCKTDKKESTLWQRIVHYFKARPNCPAPDDWKKKAAKEKAEKFAKIAGLVVCDPKDLPPKKKICALEELPKVITPKCPKLPFKCDSDASKRAFSTNCVIQEHADGVKAFGGRSLHLNSRETRVTTVCTRRYSIYTAMDDENKVSLDGEDVFACKKDMISDDGITGGDRTYYSNRTPVGDEDRDSLDGEVVLACKKDTISDDRMTGGDRTYYSNSTPVGDEDRDSLDGEDVVACKKGAISNGRMTGGDRRYFSTSTRIGDEERDSLDGKNIKTHKKDTISSRHRKNLIMSKAVCTAAQSSDDSGINKNLDSKYDFDQRVMSEAHEDLHKVHKAPIITEESRSLIDILRDDVDDLVDMKLLGDDSSLCDRNSVRKWNTGSRDKIKKRYFCTRANRHNLDDINKSLEEEEKKRLAEKILKPYLEYAADFEEHLDDNVQGSQIQEDIPGRNPVEAENDDYLKVVGQKKLGFFDVMFQEPVNDTTGYNQAKAFAAFREFFHKIEVFSDVNYEEIETNKTDSMVQELDRLMDGRNQKKKE